MKRIFIFDLDGTIGEKTPSYPNITESNASFLRKIATSEDNTLFFATGRPRSQAVQGWSKGGINEEEMRNMFSGRVYEDGLFVEYGNNIIYNATNEAPEIFRRIKNAFFDSQAKDFFRERGFLLVPGKVVKQNGDVFELTDYTGKFIGELNVPVGLVPLYQQGNDVRETYKLPEGFLGGDLEKQAPVFEKVGKISREHLELRFPGWQEGAELMIWQDSAEIYPRLQEDVFIKGIGLGRILSKIDLPRETFTYVCCDNKNDISLIKWVAENFPNYHVVCPSNINSELRESLKAGNFKHTILEQDCKTLTQGLETIVQLGEST